MGNYSCLLWVLLFVEGISSEETKTKEVTVGDNVTLEGFSGVTSNDQILWKFNNYIIVNVEEAAGKKIFSEDVKFKNRLKLDKQTGSLTITDTKSIHGGMYQLEISGNEDIKLKKFSVTVHAKSGAPSGICGAGVGLVVWAVAVFLLQEV